ncbi:MAG TPA: exodeoxyribonuclease VII small subunit [Gammaproteobacteria bacterium]|nr:exodeoxyribonuclease VII small subunit [Gammaproteobacteria bacterium]
MNHLSFDTAYAELEKIVKQIENESVPLDELAARVKEAKQLIRYCEEKLRAVEHELNHDDAADEEA